MAEVSGGRARVRYKDASDDVTITMDDGSEDGASLVVPPSFLAAGSVEACTVMLTRDNPSLLLRKEDVEEAVYAAFDNELVRPTIEIIRKYNSDNKIICVKFSDSAPAAFLIKKKNIKIKDCNLL